MIRATLLVAGLIGATAWLGPVVLDNLAIDDRSTEFQQAKDLEDAQRVAQARDRFAKVARYLCGPQSPWREVSHGVIQCMTRAGKPTTKFSTQE